MRSGWMILVLALAHAAAPLTASADDAQVEKQLQEMQERLLQLEDKLHHTTEQLDAATQEVNEHKQVMSNAGLNVDEGVSGVSSFLQSLEVNGWVNISYWHNFNDPTNGECPGDAFSLDGTADDDDDNNNDFFRLDCQDLLPAALNANTGNGATAIGTTAGLGKALLPGGFFNPTNPDAQGFSFDQAWFELGRPTSPEQRSGFRFDVTFGKIADILQARSSNNIRDARSDNDLYIHQANIQYLADVPWMGDVNFTLGKFQTLVGYEVPQAPYNYNISRGIVWGFFQPVDHLGLLASGTIDRRYHLFGVEGQLDWDLGFVNGFDADDPDLNHAKTFTGRLRMTGENWSIQVAGLVGKEDGAPNRVDCDDDPFADNSGLCKLFESVFDDRGEVGDANLAQTNVGFGGSESEVTTLFDLIMTWDPFTDLSLWMNVNRMWVNSDGADPDAWGIAVGGHYTINERLGFTLRSEFLQWEDPGGTLLGFTNVRLPFGSSGFFATDTCERGASGRTQNFTCQFGSDADVFSITATLGYQLTDQIKIRSEIRYDNFELFGRRGNAGLLASDQIFNEGTADIRVEDDDDSDCDVCGGDSDQFVAGVDVIYEF